MEAWNRSRVVLWWGALGLAIFFMGASLQLSFELFRRGESGAIVLAVLLIGSLPIVVLLLRLTRSAPGTASDDEYRRAVEPYIDCLMTPNCRERLISQFTTWLESNQPNVDVFDFEEPWKAVVVASEGGKLDTM